MTEGCRARTRSGTPDLWRMKILAPRVLHLHFISRSVVKMSMSSRAPRRSTLANDTLQTPDCSTSRRRCRFANSLPRRATSGSWATPTVRRKLSSADGDDKDDSSLKPLERRSSSDLRSPATDPAATDCRRIFQQVKVSQSDRTIGVRGHLAVLSPNSTWLVTSRHNTTRSTCRERQDERVKPCCWTSSTAKMHGLNTTNVSSPCTLAVSSFSNSKALHARRD